MSALADLRYLKMNGLGNEIVVVDLRGRDIAIPADDAAAIARTPSSRFDQLMAIHDSARPGEDALLRIYNADGSPAGACGNGMRCVAAAMHDDPDMKRPHGERLRLRTAAGILEAWRETGDIYTIDMGAPKLRWDQIPLSEEFADTRTIELQVGPIDAPVLHSPSAVSMGNPHAIFWVPDVEAVDLGRVGPLLEFHPIFPERANISVAAIEAPDHIRLRVWERGAGLTRACGSAACAVVVAAARKGLTGREATVTLPGGDLRIVWRESDGHVLMTGPIAWEHEGRFAPELFGAAAGAAAA